MIYAFSRFSDSVGARFATWKRISNIKKGVDIMSKYLVEASRKAGLFEPYEPHKYYIMSQERLSKMLLQSVSWAVWSAKRVNLELTPFEQLESIYGEIEIMD